MLLLLPEVLSDDLPKNHKIQDDNYNVDSRANNIKKNEPKKTRMNSNNNDVLANTSFNCQNRIMIVANSITTMD